MFAVAETTAISCAVIPAAALLPHFDIYGHSVPPSPFDWRCFRICSQLGSC